MAVISAHERSKKHSTLLSVLGLLSLWCWTVPALAHPVLDEAEREYANQNHRRVIELVRPLVEPRSVLATEDEEVEAFRLLALSYWWLKDYKTSEANFLILLSLRPNFRLNPALNPPALLRFLEGVREKLRRKPQEIKRRQIEELNDCRWKLRRAEKANVLLRRRCTETVIEKRSLWPNFLPFGVGQFNNGDILKGWVFFGVEATLLLINATSYILAETSWVRNGPSGTVRNDPASIQRARTIQALEITSGVLLAATALAGIIEAVVSYRPTRIVSKRRVRVGPARLGPASLGGARLTLEWDL